MENIKEFRKLVKSLPEGDRARLPEKIRGLCNRPEHTDFLKAIVLGAYLDLQSEISLTGYVHVPVEISPDERYCTAIRDEVADKMLVGVNEIKSKMSAQDFKNKVLYA